MYIRNSLGKPLLDITILNTGLGFVVIQIENYTLQHGNCGYPLLVHYWTSLNQDKKWISINQLTDIQKLNR